MRTSSRETTSANKRRDREKDAPGRRFFLPLTWETFTKETRQAMFLRSLLSGACTSRTWCHARGNSFVNSFTVRWRALWRNHVALTQTGERTREEKKGGRTPTSQQRKFPGGKIELLKSFPFTFRTWLICRKFSFNDRTDSDSWSCRRNCCPSPSTRGRV